MRVQKVLNPDAYFTGANVITRITGYSLSKSRTLMNNLPQTIPTPLYKHSSTVFSQRITEVFNPSRGIFLILIGSMLRWSWLTINQMLP